MGEEDLVVVDSIPGPPLKWRVGRASAAGRHLSSVHPAYRTVHVEPIGIITVTRSPLSVGPVADT